MVSYNNHAVNKSPKKIMTSEMVAPIISNKINKVKGGNSKKW